MLHFGFALRTAREAEVRFTQNNESDIDIRILRLIVVRIKSSESPALVSEPDDHSRGVGRSHGLDGFRLRGQRPAAI